MKFNATLCSTDGNEPWAANVGMTLSGKEIITKLRTSYTHYKNIANNSNVAIAYKNPSSEILIKATATINKPEGDVAMVIIQPTWMRLVENDSTNDTSNINEIIDTLTQRIVSQGLLAL